MYIFYVNPIEKKTSSGDLTSFSSKPNHFLCMTSNKNKSSTCTVIVHTYEYIHQSTFKYTNFDF